MFLSLKWTGPKPHKKLCSTGRDKHWAWRRVIKDFTVNKITSTVCQKKTLPHPSRLLHTQPSIWPGWPRPHTVGKAPKNIQKYADSCSNVCFPTDTKTDGNLDSLGIPNWLITKQLITDRYFSDIRCIWKSLQAVSNE